MSNSTTKKIVLAAEGGKLYEYSFSTKKLRLIFEDTHSEALMGLAKIGEWLFIGAKSYIYKLSLRTGKILSSDKAVARRSLIKKGMPDFHQMIIQESTLLITATGTNEIWLYSLDLKLLDIKKVKPPTPFFPVVYKYNYNHVNSIYADENSFYVSLNWFTNKPYGSSGVAVLNKEFKELERYKYGWEMHNFIIQDGQKIALCGSSGGIKKINHPHKAGLLVNGKLVFEHDPSTHFCKAMTYHDNCYYIVGGSIETREHRKNASGVLYIVDKKSYRLVETIEFPKSGGFCGCLIIP